MTRKAILASTVITCDCCGVECAGSNYVHEGKLTLTRAALDFQGCPVADASIRLDLCDRCNSEIGSAINEAASRLRAAIRARGTT